MGLGRDAVEALIRESVHKQMYGDVLLIGRQTIYLPPEAMLLLLQEHGIDTGGIDPSSIELDTNTIDRNPNAHFSQDTLISDVSFLKILGAKNVRALDHSDYEDADIIHDLRYPLPQNLHESADFVIDGSTLDNVFTPSVTLQNYCKLLRPGGRLFATNAFSAYETPYAIMPPMWYIDYFVMNKFVDCRVYIIVYHHHCINIFYVDLEEVKAAERQMGRFCSPYNMSTIILAEKGPDSTSDVLPNQQDYRSEQEWKVYQKNLERMLQSKRPHLNRSSCPLFFPEAARGHLYIDQKFVARRQSK